MDKFRTKPVVIEAEQYSRQQHIETGYVPEGVTKRQIPNEDGGSHEGTPVITTLESEMRVSDGDWIIKGVAGEFYTCKPEIFEQTYEKVEAD